MYVNFRNNNTHARPPYVYFFLLTYPTYFLT